MADFDLVVVGSGLAGMSAALEASARDATVLLVEADTIVGGRTNASTGMIMGAGTRFQSGRGIVDSSDDLYHHYMTLTGRRLEPAVIEHLTRQVGPSIEWLADLGVEILDIYFAGDELVPRGHVTHGGARIIEVLDQQARRRPAITYALKQRVDRLLTVGGRVCGVASGDEEVTADAVILATGGFEGDPQLLDEYYPKSAAAGLEAPSRSRGRQPGIPRGHLRLGRASRRSDHRAQPRPVHP